MCSNYPVLVGRKAPSFRAQAVVDGNKIVDDFSIDQYLGNKYVVLFFYPKDFTFVCPTELHAFQDAMAEFESRSVQLVACSTDTEYCHWAWLHMKRDEGGISGVTYPLVADTNKTISRSYGVLAGDSYYDDDGELHVEGSLVAYRGLFLIDKQGIVQHEVVNNMPLGRSVKETLRMIDALQHFEKHGEVCPMNWEKGSKSMKPTDSGLKDYFKD